MLSPSYVVEEHHLRVLVALNLHPLGSVAWWILGWVHVDDLPVSFVSEQQALVGVGVHPEVWRVVQGRVLRVPVEEAQVRLLWHEHFLALEDLPKVFRFQSVRQVDVAGDLVLAFSLVSNEDDGGHPSAPDIVLPVGQRLEEVRVVNLAALVALCLGLFGVLIFLGEQVLLLSLSELIAGQDLSFAVVPDLNQLSCKLLVL